MTVLELGNHVNPSFSRDGKRVYFNNNTGNGVSQAYMVILPESNDTDPPAVPSNILATGNDGFVSLNWDDNSESDLTGYNVYRSTTSGSGYSKLNGSLLSTSDYTDSSFAHPFKVVNVSDVQ